MVTVRLVNVSVNPAGNFRALMCGIAYAAQVHADDLETRLNPVELLNADTKRHVAQTNPGNKHELAAETRTHLRRRQNQPDRVRAFFGKEEVRYAAK